MSSPSGHIVFRESRNEQKQELSITFLFFELQHWFGAQTKQKHHICTARNHQIIARSFTFYNKSEKLKTPIFQRMRYTCKDLWAFFKVFRAHSSTGVVIYHSLKYLVTSPYTGMFQVSTNHDKIAQIDETNHARQRTRVHSNSPRILAFLSPVAFLPVSLHTSLLASWSLHPYFFP